MNIKSLARKIFYPNHHSSEAYVNYLRKKGCHIGEQTFFFNPLKTVVDLTRPYLINIGNYCRITSGVIVLSHDYSRSVLRMKYKEIIGEAGLTHIGDNVFIGMNAIILRNVRIGNNVIVGAGSVVAYDIPDNSVAAGNPARVIMTLDEYYSKRKDQYINEAREYAREIQKRTRSKPTIAEMTNFYPLYLKRDLDEIEKYNLQIKYSGDDYEDTVKCFLESKPVYKNFEEFLKDSGIE